MSSDDSVRSMHYSQNRKPGMSKPQGYSPSMNYNYNGNQAQHGNHGNHGNSNFSNQQHQRRKPGQFKRDNHNSNDRLVKQNDIIIRILKEIRDRLPAPPAVEGDGEIKDQYDETGVAEQDSSAPVQTEESEVPSEQQEQSAAPVDLNDDELDSEVNGNR